MTARRKKGAAAVRALRRATRAWLHAHRALHAETARLWPYGPGGGPTGPIRPPAAAPPPGEGRR